ncbi:MAG: transaldolase family protein [Anaerolineae bacterium]
MDLYLDSADPSEIAEACAMGLIAGVTTNPNLIATAGPDMVATLQGVLEASPGPVLAQAVGWHDPEPLVAQARWLHSLSDRIVVKLPMSSAGIQALRRLKQELPELRIAVTTVASVAQAYLCGKMGADIVALFNGPLDEVSDTPVELVQPVRRIYDNYGFATRILSCGRLPRLFGQFAEAGTDICTMRLPFMRLLYEHPFTDKRMTGFLETWKATFGEDTWPQEGASR